MLCLFLWEMSDSAVRLHWEDVTQILSLISEAVVNEYNIEGSSQIAFLSNYWLIAMTLLDIMGGNACWLEASWLTPLYTITTIICETMDPFANVNEANAHKS